MAKWMLLVLLTMAALPSLAQKRLLKRPDAAQQEEIRQNLHHYRQELNAQVLLLQQAKDKQQIKKAAIAIRQTCETYQEQLRQLAPDPDQVPKIAGLVQQTQSATGPAATLMHSSALISYLEAHRPPEAKQLRELERITHLAWRIQLQHQSPRLPSLIRRLSYYNDQLQ